MITSLPAQFRAEAERLEQYGPDRAAGAFRRAAAMLEEAITDAGDTPLTPAEVAALGVCSAETVRRKVRAGELENVGTPGKVQVRAVDAGKLAKQRGRPSKRSQYGKVSRRVGLTSIRGEG